MDPVNKWITVIVCIFVALLITIAWKAGAGKYEITVIESQYEGYQAIYVLNTKTGEVKAKLHNQEEHLTKAGKVKDYFVVVKDKTRYGYGRSQEYPAKPKALLGTKP